MKRAIVYLTPYYVALINVGFSLVIGIWILLPFDLFRYPVYDHMAHIAPEPLWGGALLFYAGFMIYSWYIQSNRLFAYSSFVAAVQFFVSAILFFMGDPRSILVPACFFVCLLTGYGYIAGKYEVIFRQPNTNLDD